MAHPNKREGVVGHNAKLKRMTQDYGMADPKMYRVTDAEKIKKEGPEEVPGFGTDYNAASARSDKAARKSMAANPVPTYAQGGGVMGRARGGRAKKSKQGTHVNVVIMPSNGNQGAANPNPALNTGPNPAIPPSMPPPPPGMPPGAPGGPPSPMAMAPGAMPPGAMPPRKRGGRIEKREGGGQVSGIGQIGTEKPDDRRNQIDPQTGKPYGGLARGGHADEKADRKLIHKMVKSSSLTGRKEGGEVEGRARGGRLPTQKHHMEAGAASGEGRLEKIGKHGKAVTEKQAV